MIKNKSGFLLGEETLKIVIAVISIGFLVYFLGALYYSGFGNKDAKLAKASLEHLVKGINSGLNEIEIYNPEDWIIMNFPQDENYICICEKPNECNLEENCMKPKKQKIIIGGIKIKDPPVVLEIEDNLIKQK